MTFKRLQLEYMKLVLYGLALLVAVLVHKGGRFRRGAEARAEAYGRKCNQWLKDAEQVEPAELGEPGDEG